MSHSFIISPKLLRPAVNLYQLFFQINHLQDFVREAISDIRAYSLIWEVLRKILKSHFDCCRHCEMEGLLKLQVDEAKDFYSSSYFDVLLGHNLARRFLSFLVSELQPTCMVGVWTWLKIIQLTFRVYGFNNLLQSYRSNQWMAILIQLDLYSHVKGHISQMK